ncbi:ubiquinone biosynthesis regulatory protein kinase UbiB [Candidatus Marimicrobium litorale]|uniref:Probable protein kinase UbiB n=1 Tax=Candidatus Marimicrobium litorale TaxID=2518991 RepID=A0ABT3T8I3_9GAMM|nr:ubiquinone biosynthesis regulatory protein kinase UbiB [Candidatus Marimicrobium litorale]MCX2978364.1 ubiquinone biosynthesis regulatory protein kinase UbiB [Candidatus Marimicrobium litorale]
MSRVLRLAKILRTAGRYRLDEFVDESKLPLPARLALRLSPWRYGKPPAESRGIRLRLALEELGTVFIKFGQALSTRRDLLPSDIADELARLQDDVPPFPEQQSVAIIEEALGKTVGELFGSFDPAPMACASIAQVHSATLQGGEQVVVKVVRPDIEPIIREDIALMFTLAKLVERYHPDGHRLRPVEVVADYELVILDELDMSREAANASQLRRNFEDKKLLYVPEIYWDYSCSNVLTMERIFGIPVTDIETLRAKGTDLKMLGERGVEIFFTQVFNDSFFHADMHPGNIFVDASDPQDPTYIGVDCAIVGSLSDADQYYLGRNLLAIFRRDYREVAQLHVECGWVPPDTRVQDFESAMRAVCEPIFERPISEISFGQLLIYLFQTASRFDMEVQPSLVLLQKTLLNIEGLGRQLYPELNLWDTAQPFLEDWVERRYSPQAVLQRLQHHAPSWIEQLPQLPEAVLESLQQTQHKPTALAESPPRQKRQSSQPLLGVILLATAALTATPDGLQIIAEAPAASWLLALTGIWLLLPRQR